MDDLDFCGLIMGLAFLIRAAFIKKNYTIFTFGTCINNVKSNATLEYEVYERGKKVVYQNQSLVFGYPKKGKKYKVLVCRKDHNKVAAYSHYIELIIVGIVAVLLAALSAVL